MCSDSKTYGNSPPILHSPAYTNLAKTKVVKVGDFFYVSAVEIIERTDRTGFSPTDALYSYHPDRNTGKGKGWLFKFNMNGRLIDKVEIWEGNNYHPGGIDYTPDLDLIWVPVAEYRPNSHAVVYVVDPHTLDYTKVLEVDDHIGGVVYNYDRHTLHGVSWGSRRLYTWDVKSLQDIRYKSWMPNPQYYIDYQDCAYQGGDYMLCTGLNKYNTPIGQVAFGGIDLIDLQTNTPVHILPAQAWIDEEGGALPETLSATNNAVWMEPVGDDTMRMYFMTETQDKADLVIYDVTRYDLDYPPDCGAYKGKGKGKGKGTMMMRKGKGKGY